MYGLLFESAQRDGTDADGTGEFSSYCPGRKIPLLADLDRRRPKLLGEEEQMAALLVSGHRTLLSTPPDYGNALQG